MEPEELHMELRVLVAELHAANPQQSDEQAKEYIVLCHQLADKLIPVFYAADDQQAFEQLRELDLSKDNMVSLRKVYQGRIRYDKRGLKAIKYALPVRHPGWNTGMSWRKKREHRPAPGPVCAPLPASPQDDYGKALPVAAQIRR
jgi:hypothetical protein